MVHGSDGGKESVAFPGAPSPEDGYICAYSMLGMRHCPGGSVKLVYGTSIPFHKEQGASRAASRITVPGEPDTNLGNDRELVRQPIFIPPQKLTGMSRLIDRSSVLQPQQDGSSMRCTFPED